MWKKVNSRFHYLVAETIPTKAQGRAECHIHVRDEFEAAFMKRSNSIARTILHTIKDLMPWFRVGIPFSHINSNRDAFQKSSLVLDHQSNVSLQKINPSFCVRLGQLYSNKAATMAKRPAPPKVLSELAVPVEDAFAASPVPEADAVPSLVLEAPLVLSLLSLLPLLDSDEEVMLLIDPVEVMVVMEAISRRGLLAKCKRIVGVL
jgi:hypothetical protein